MVAERWLISPAAPVKACKRLSACSPSYASAALLLSSVSFAIARTKKPVPLPARDFLPGLSILLSASNPSSHRANGKNRRKRVMLSGSEASEVAPLWSPRCFAAAQHDTFAHTFCRLLCCRRCFAAAQHDTFAHTFCRLLCCRGDD